MPAAVDSLTVARRHTLALGAIALASIESAVPMWTVAHGPGGVDPLYVALAMQFAIWGLIDLAFALRGLPQLLRICHGDRDAVETMRSRTLALLHVSGWLNVLYLAVGVALLAAGLHARSASLTGHGVGVLLQAIPLTILDASFAHGLRRAPAA